MAFLLAAAFSCSGVSAQVLFHFDFPEQSLAQSLKAIGTATSTDIGFSSNQVAGLVAPSLKADLTVDDALLRVLAGTGLRPQHLDDHTILISATGSSAAGSAEMKLLRVKSPTPAVVDDRTMTPQARAVGESTDNSSSVNANNKELDEIVVTGTHIRRISPASPVQTITREDIDRSGYAVVGDLINSIPQNFPGQQSAAGTVGNAPGLFSNPSNGIAPDLRGLGAGSTLTLVDGHRLAEDFNGSVDISLIPLAAVERVEVVTDGASTAYGSDAVAGVVNFILKKPYDGAISSLATGYATEGGAFESDIGQQIGKTWSNGGVLLTYEHFRQDDVLASQRTFTSSVFMPYTLLPESRRDTAALTFNQRLTDGISAFAESLYTNRFTSVTQAYSSTYVSAVPTTVNQLQVTAGVSADLPADWRTSLALGDASQRTGSSNYQVAGGTSQFQYRNDLRGVTKSGEVTLDGPVASFQRSTIRAALGAGYRQESFDDRISSLEHPQAQGQRNIKHVFGEFNIPLVPASERTGAMRLDLNAGIRYEEYSDFGNKSSPKAGLTFVPTSGVTARATWSQSFRAPTFYESLAAHDAGVYQLADPKSPSGSSYILDSQGGNPGLKPETANSWTLGVDLAPSALPGFRASTTYFHIAYTNRIGYLVDFYSSLSDPASAAFVTRNPSANLLQGVLARAEAGSGYFNATSNPAYNTPNFDPSTIAALVNEMPLNIARQVASGADLRLDYQLRLGAMTWNTFLNGSYLHLTQQTTPQVPDLQVAGTAFYPPHFRARAGTTVQDGAWQATAVVHYLGSEINTYQPTSPHVTSWITTDVNLAYAPSLKGFASGLRVSLSAQNVFDRHPPYLLFDTYVPGVHYDSLNTSPLGRYLSLQISKSWK
jgi:outer membrane receptor protein involved in Fe transport